MPAPTPLKPKTTAKPATVPTKPVQAPASTKPTATPAAPAATLAKPNDKKTPVAGKPDTNPKFTYLLKVTIGELEFSNLKGDFLGTPVIRLRTRQYSEIDFILSAGNQAANADELAENKLQKDGKIQTLDGKPAPSPPQNAAAKPNSAVTTALDKKGSAIAGKSDPLLGMLDSAIAAKKGEGKDKKPADVKSFLASVSTNVAQLPTSSVPVDDKKSAGVGGVWSQIMQNMGSAVKVEVGYLPDQVYTVLEGQAYRIGRKFPDGVIIEVVDSSAQMANTTGGTVINAEENPPAITVKTTQAIKKLLGTQAKAGSTEEFLNNTDFSLPISGAAPKPSNAPKPNQPPASLAKPAVSMGDIASFMKGVPTSVTPLTVAASQPTTASAAGVKMQAQASAAAIPKSAIAPKSAAEQFANQKGLQFSKQTQSATGSKGSASFGVNPLQSATTEAAKKGDVIVAEGNQIKQVGAGQGEPSGITLDWNQHRNVFIKPPVITKKTPLQLQSGAGSLVTQNFSVSDKSLVVGAAVTPGGVSPNPNGVILAPEWGAVKNKDPIYAGSSFTWGDATSQGTRKPESKKIMQNIIGISQVLDGLAKEFGVKFIITSWYRPPHVNVQVSSSGPNGPHTTGSAIDFYCDPKKLIAIHKKLDKTWAGGVAIHPAVYSGSGGFVHIDLIGAGSAVQGGLPGSAKRRWSY